MVCYPRWIERMRVVAGAMAMGLALRALFSAATGRIGHDLGQYRLVFVGMPSPWLSLDSPFLASAAEQTVGYAGKVLRMLAESFWGSFGWYQVAIDRPALAGYSILAGLSLAGWIGCRGDQSAVRLHDRRALVVLIGAIIAFLGCLAMVYHRLYIPQGGRYLLTVASPIALVFALGLLGLWSSISRRMAGVATERQFAWAIVAIMVGLNWWVLWRSIICPYAIAWSGTPS